MPRVSEQICAEMLQTICAQICVEICVQDMCGIVVGIVWHDGCGTNTTIYLAILRTKLYILLTPIRVLSCWQFDTKFVHKFLSVKTKKKPGKFAGLFCWFFFVFIRQSIDG